MSRAVCPSCGRTLPPGIPGGSCPACLLGLMGGAAPWAAAEDSALHAHPVSEEMPSGAIGHYRLLEVIGEGGFGAVWMAEQQEPVRRKVALKIIKPGMDSRQVIARFEAERQALALMDHPNIARVFDGGTTETGRPYFVMELVRGLPITEFCDARQMTTRERLELFIAVCQAVQHAHQKGVIHRDLKPSNILVTEQDGKPVPKVIDFGVAKAVAEPLTDKTLFTRFHQFIGTPAYMSPEQAGLGGLDVDTRTDIFSLGVLLYELLTGRPPLDPKQLRDLGLEAMLRSIRESEAPRPSTRLSTLNRKDLTAVAAHRREDPQRLSRLVQGDLDWIVLKALEKDRSRRYDTANGLAADVRRYLENEPVGARPPSRWYRLQKAWRRNRLVFSAGFAVTAAVLVGLAVSTWMYVREAAAFREARVAESEQRRLLAVTQASAQSLREALYASEMNVAYHAWESGSEMRARTLLDRQRPSGRSNEPDLRGFEWRYLWAMTRPQERFTLTNAATWGLGVSPDGRWMAGGMSRAGGTNEDAHLRLWDLSERREVITLRTNATWMFSLAFSADGRKLAEPFRTNQVTIWDLESRSISTTLQLEGCEEILGVAFSPDSQWIVATGGYMYSDSDERPGHVGLWNAETGRLLWARNLPRWVQQACFSPDGWTVAVACGDGVVRILDATDGAVRLECPRASGFVLAVAFSMNGASVAAGDEKGYVRVWDARSGHPEVTFKAHEFPIYAVQFTRDGRRLVTGSRDFTARLWDRQSGAELARFAGHEGGVNTVHVLPDDSTLVTSSQDNHIKVWDLLAPRPHSLITRSPGGYQSTHAFVGESNTLAVVNPGPGKIQFLNPVTGKEIHALLGLGLATTRNGQQLAMLQSNRVVLLDPTTFQELGAVDCGDVLGGNPSFSPDGRLLAFRRKNPQMGPGGERVAIVNVAQRQIVREIETEGEGNGPVFFARNGLVLLTFQRDTQRVDVWDWSSGMRLGRFQGPPASPAVADVSPDGRLLAVSGHTGRLQFWDLDRLEALDPIDLGIGRVDAIAFDPEGRNLAIGNLQGTVRIWNCSARQEIASFRGHRSLVSGLSFSLDGRFLASNSLDQTLHLWSAPSWKEIQATEPGEAGSPTNPPGNLKR